MARRKPWYQSLFERDYFDYFYVGGPRGQFDAEEAARRAEEQVDFILDALQLPEGGDVLDLCCGWGRHSVPLAKRGYHVTGVDSSAYHLKLAQAAARRAGVDVRWAQRDMRQLRYRERFDGAINMFTSFGYFERQADDERVLRRVAAALDRGGRFLLDTINHDHLMRVFRNEDWRAGRDGGMALERRRYDVRTGRIDVDMIYITPEGKRRKRWHSLRLYTFTELAVMLAGAGLHVVETWGDFDGSDLTMHSPRMIVLAEKRSR